MNKRRAELGTDSFHLFAPVTPGSLRVWATSAHDLRSFRLPLPPPARHRSRPQRKRRVLIRNPWNAVDRISEDWDLVICSFDMIHGKQKLHAALWKARPELERYFALLVDHPDPMQRRTTGRPLSMVSIQALLDRIDFLPSATTD